MSFKATGLPQSLLTALAEKNFEKPYPIQAKAIPVILKNKDVLGIAQTGSGKTASFVLPILTLLQKQTDFQNRFIQTLVLVPTRELAMQVQEVFYEFGKEMARPIKSMAVFGGASINPQMKAMMGVQVLMATPGRLLELVEKKAVQLSKVKTLVLDEADKMLNLGFQEEMNQIIKMLPTLRQNLLFSATLNNQVNEITQLVLRDPEVIHIEQEADQLDLIKQTGYFVEDQRKGLLLRHLIKEGALKQVLVFTSSVYKADHVANKLFNNGIQAKAIHSKKSMKSRKTALSEFKNGELTVLVATDLLSRGIDIEFLPYVVNYELPRSPKDFVHRIGRTGRAESPGEAITFVSNEEKHHFKIIQKKMGKWVTMIDSENLEF